MVAFIDAPTQKEFGQEHVRAMAEAACLYRARQEAEAAEDERQRRALAAAERVSLRRCRDQELGVRFQRASENSSGGSMGSRLEQVGAKLTHVFGKRGEKLKVEFEQSESKNCAKIDMQASYGDRANEDADLVERSLKNGESVAANLTVTAKPGMVYCSREFRQSEPVLWDRFREIKPGQVLSTDSNAHQQFMGGRYPSMVEKCAGLPRQLAEDQKESKADSSYKEFEQPKSGGHRESTWTATDPGAKDKGGASEESSDYVAYLTEPGSFVLGEATSFVTAPLTYLWGSSPPSSSSSSFRMRH